jgi:hypothetical protein
MRTFNIMNMTTDKILSLPVYLVGTILGIVAAILILPGLVVMSMAGGLYWLADRMATGDTEDCATIHGEYKCDTTIEEYEKDILFSMPVVEFETHPEPGFKFTLQQCSNCAYDDACCPVKGNWCDMWESDCED